jgi:hypothetical protein
VSTVGSAAAVEPPRRGRPASLRLASGLHLLLGAGFGAGAAVVLDQFAKHGELPMSPFGWRYMAGPFEDLGPPAFTALGWSLVAVCAVDAIAGLWLWQGRRGGLRLSLATAVPAFALAVGFELPFLLVGVPIRTALALRARHSLT